MAGRRAGGRRNVAGNRGFWSVLAAVLGVLVAVLPACSSAPSPSDARGFEAAVTARRGLSSGAGATAAAGASAATGEPRSARATTAGFTTTGRPKSVPDAGGRARTDLGAQPTAEHRAARPAEATFVPASLQDCRERFLIAPGDPEAVRAAVPSAFTLRTTSSGRPLLYVSAIRCERYTAGGVTAAVTAAAFGASIESPDGTACASHWPAARDVDPGLAGSCNNYLLMVGYDHPAVVEWAQAGFGDLPVTWVPGLTFDEQPAGPASSRLRFAAPGPAPSPFTLDVEVRSRAASTTLAGAFWFLSEGGLVRFGFEADDFAMGEASGRLDPAPGSEMARLFGGDRRVESSLPYSQMGGAHWTRAVLTKERGRL